MQSTCIMRTHTYKEKITELLTRNHLMSIADIHAQIPEADYSTIFRNVEQLVLNKELKKVVLGKGDVKYENIIHTHHHFICDTCGTVEEIEVELKNKTKSIRDVVVYGDCNKCT